MYFIAKYDQYNREKNQERKNEYSNLTVPSYLKPNCTMLSIDFLPSFTIL